VVEPLAVPTIHGAIFLGIQALAGTDDPRLWASSNDSGKVFQRDPDPSTTLDRMRVPRVPMLRLEVSPTR
jgi:hypothetical protein